MRPLTLYKLLELITIIWANLRLVLPFIKNNNDNFLNLPKSNNLDAPIDPVV